MLWFDVPIDGQPRQRHDDDYGQVDNLVHGAISFQRRESRNGAQVSVTKAGSSNCVQSNLGVANISGGDAVEWVNKSS
jgi:hypothetical protein